MRSLQLAFHEGLWHRTWVTRCTGSTRFAGCWTWTCPVRCPPWRKIRSPGCPRVAGYADGTVRIPLAHRALRDATMDPLRRERIRQRGRARRRKGNAGHQSRQLDLLAQGRQINETSGEPRSSLFTPSTLGNRSRVRRNRRPTSSKATRARSWYILVTSLRSWGVAWSLIKTRAPSPTIRRPPGFKVANTAPPGNSRLKSRRGLSPTSLEPH